MHYVVYQLTSCSNVNNRLSGIQANSALSKNKCVDTHNLASQDSFPGLVSKRFLERLLRIVSEIMKKAPPEPPPPMFMAVHRWRAARMETPIAQVEPLAWTPPLVFRQSWKILFLVENLVLKLFIVHLQPRIQGNWSVERRGT